VKRLATRIYGQPPAPDAPRLEKLIWVRRTAYYGTVWAWVLIAAVFVLTISSLAGWIVLAVCGSMWLSGFASINLRIRRERRRGSGGLQSVR
jgi:hypothetical protein